jgi:hypothetical protein
VPLLLQQEGQGEQDWLGPQRGQRQVVGVVRGPAPLKVAAGAVGARQRAPLLLLLLLLLPHLQLLCLVPQPLQL